MKKNMYKKILAIISIAILFSACKKNIPVICNCDPNDLVTTMTVFSSGFNNPRGLKFGPDGYLYVAEGGVGGTDTSTTCAQVLPPIGPYLGSITGSRISRVNQNGERTTFVDNLPSSQTGVATGSLVSGVADIAFIDHTLYALITGAGCSHGVPDFPNSVIRINHDQSWKIIADLSNYYLNTTVANPSTNGDYEPDGTPYSMIALGGEFFVVEPNHGELDKVTLNGKIKRIIDISASQGHIVPTVVAFHHGNFYVGNLNVFPITGNSSIYKITPAGNISVVATGFSTILGITFDRFGGLYVLENTTHNDFPTPGTGDIIRIDPTGDRLIVATGLNLPTGLTIGPDEKLYVSNWGFGAPPGTGEILQIDLSCRSQHGFKK